MNKFSTILRESGPARFLIPAGVILLVFGIFMFFVNKNNSNYIQTEATITKCELVSEAYVDTDGTQVDATYKVYFKYIVDGKEYTSDFDGVGKMKEGDKLTIYYNPDNPAEVTQTISLVLPIAIIVGGVGMLVGGIISAMNAYKRIQKLKEQEKGWENAK